VRSPRKFIPHTPAMVRVGISPTTISNAFYEQSEFALTPKLVPLLATPKRQVTGLALEVIQAPPGTAQSPRPTH
jgi:hypothetical protein